MFTSDTPSSTAKRSTRLRSAKSVSSWVARVSLLSVTQMIGRASESLFAITGASASSGS